MEKTTLTKFRLTEAFLRDQNYTSHFSQSVAFSLSSGNARKAREIAVRYTGARY